MQEKIMNESNLSMQVGPSTATAELQTTAEQVRKEENRGGIAIEAIAKRALMKQTENGMQTSGSDNNTYKMNEEFGKVAVGNESGRNKRKPNSVRHIIQENIKQSGSETKNTVQLYFDETDEDPIDLSNRNGQDNQSDGTISDEQYCEDKLDKQDGEKVDSPGNASSNVKRKRTESKLLNLNQRYGNRTFSTFTSAEQDELRNKALHIYEGATFRSFDEFQECFETYKIVWNFPYRVASSEVLRDGEGRVINRFKYKYIVFHCAHYGRPRKRGVGKRPNQNYLPLGCKARFRLNADTTNGCLRISSFHKEHTNHDNTEEDYLRVINKKRRNLTGGPGSKIKKEEKTGETEEAMPRYDNSEKANPNVNEHVNAPEIAENKSASTILSSGNSILVISSQQENSDPVTSSSRNSTLAISSQGNSAFVPVIRSTEMPEQNDGIQQMLQQNIPPINSLLQQIFTARLFDRLQRIEYLIMNVYIINCGRCLPQEVYQPFIYAVYGAEYCLSEWSNVQLRDVMIILLQPPEILLRGKLPIDISINEVKQVRPPSIQRAITAIREEKLKRFDKIIARFVGHIFNAVSLPDFFMAVREFEKLADDVRNMSANNITSYDKDMLQC